MKAAAFALASNITSVAFVVGAAALAFYGQDGWGWMILGAILTHTGVEWKSGKAAEKDEGEE